MKLVALLFLVCGVALAGGAIYYAQEHFAMLAQKEEKTGPEMVKVLTANTRLAYGEVIDKKAGNEKLIWRDWPADSIPNGAFTDGKDFLGKDFEQARTVLINIEPGLPILRSMVSDFGRGVGLRVSPGMVAVTIPINAVSAVAGHINPGDRVDIEYTRRGGGTLTSVILLSNVKIIAIDQMSDTQTKGPRVGSTATVEVSRDDARRLRLALQSGSLALFLRDQSDTSASTASETLDLSDLPGAEKPVEAPAPAPAPEPVVEKEDDGYQVRVRKGGVTQTFTFQD